MTERAIACWHCGAVLPGELLPLRREETCPACDADLHVCRLCRFYNPAVSDACDEPVAAPVSNKERANFCDYFSPAPDAFRGRDAAAGDRARAELDALFGSGDAPPASDADASRAELDRLFGLDED